MSLHHCLTTVYVSHSGFVFNDFRLAFLTHAHIFLSSLFLTESKYSVRWIILVSNVRSLCKTQRGTGRSEKAREEADVAARGTWFRKIEDRRDETRGRRSQSTNFYAVSFFKKLHFTSTFQKRQIPMVETKGTSTTNIIISKTDRGVQVWAVCMACQRKLESCEKQPPTVIITK